MFVRTSNSNLFRLKTFFIIQVLLDFGCVNIIVACDSKKVMQEMRVHLQKFTLNFKGRYLPYQCYRYTNGNESSDSIDGRHKKHVLYSRNLFMILR